MFARERAGILQEGTARTSLLKGKSSGLNPSDREGKEVFPVLSPWDGNVATDTQMLTDVLHHTLLPEPPLDGMEKRVCFVVYVTFIQGDTSTNAKHSPDSFTAS